MTQTGRHEPIAIVGMACRLPGGARTPAALWELLLSGRDGVSDIPPGRWDVDAHYDPDPGAPGKMTTRRGGFIEGIDLFDPAFFGISPREAADMDPQQRLLLMVAYEALEDAGLPLPSVAGKKGGVFVGISSDEYRVLSTTRDFVGLYSGTGLAFSIAANRISYSFDLRGPSLAVDTACSSALVAVHLACKSLIDGESSFALAAGVNALLVPGSFAGMSKGGFLAPDGRCKSFDAAANGYVRAEGAGVVVLKKLSQALADGDRVYALIRGTAVNQDGRTNGLTAPSGPAQEVVLRAAYEDAGVDPSRVRYVEAHGTGTPLGDPIEARALGRVIGAGRAAPEDACWIGSVKSNIGHLESAAGVASLIKTALVLRHREIPPTLHFREANPQIPFADLGLRVAAARTTLERGDGPLIAGVTSFGFGGTNAHAVLEEAPAVDALVASAAGARVLVVSGKTPEAARELARAHAAALRAPGAPTLEDTCATAFSRRSRFRHRIAAVGRDAAEMAQALEERALAGQVKPSPEVALVFSGQGSQWAGMARDLAAAEPVFRDALAEIDAALAPHTGGSVLAAFTDAERLLETEVAQPAIFAVQVALARLLAHHGVTPRAVLGHSVGEVAAACVAGALSLPDAARLVALRGRFVQRARGGAMCAVALPAAEIELGSGLWIAAVNGPSSTAVAGDAAAVAAARARFEARGVRTHALAMPFAFHSGHMDALLPGLRDALGWLPRGAASEVEIYSTSAGRRVEPEALDAGHWIAAVRRPVLFADAVAAAAQDGITTFVEVGPHTVHAGDLGRILCDTGRAAGKGDAVVIATQRRDEAGDLTYRAALARLFVEGVDATVVDGPRRPPVTLPTYAFQLQRCWNEVDPAAGRPRAAAATHDLLGARLALARDDGALVWEQRLSLASTPWLAEHVVQGKTVVPGAAYLEMVLAADDEAHGMGRRDIEDVELLAPLVLEPGRERRVQLTLSPCGVDEAMFTVASLGENEPTWSLHCSGRILRGARLADVVVEAAPPPAGEAVDVADFYRGLAEAALAYGPAFRTVRSLRRSPGAAVAEIAVPPVGARRHNLHPAALDGAFQALAAALGDDAGAATYVPVKLARSTWLRHPGDTLMARVRIEEGAAGAHEIAATIELHDGGGGAVARLQGFRVRRLAGARRDEVPLHKMSWTRIDAPAAGPAGRWLVLDDGGELAARLAAALSAERCPDVATLVARVGDDAGVAVVTERPADVLALVRGLAGVPARLRLALVTRRATAAGEVAPDADQALLWGLFSVVRSEHGEWRPRRIDVAGAGDAALAARVLAADLDEDELAVRGDDLFVPRLVPVSGSEAPLAASSAASALRAVAGGLALAPLTRRAPGAGEVEIEIAAAGLNFRDVMKSLGLYPGAGPDRMWLGDECSGVIRAVGAGVRDLAVGQKVIAVAGQSLATHVTADAGLVVPLPASLSLAEGAAIPVAFLTAWYGLVEVARVARGERVLVHAAAGGVGLAAIEIARHLGAEVIATAGSDRKRDFLRRRGVATVLDPRAADFGAAVLLATGGRGVDVVLNSLAGDAITRSAACLAPFGRFVEIGKTDVFANRQLGLYLLRKNASFSVVDLEMVFAEKRELARAMLRRIVELLASGELRPPPSTAFPLERARDAFATMQGRRNIGKLVITCDAGGPRVRGDATYLVTGGLGGLGLLTAASLARLGARHLALLGRQAPGEPARRAIAELERDGVTVRAVQADVTSAAAVTRALAEIERELPPVRGVVHAAGVLADAALEAVTDDEWRRVVAPKLDGARALEQALAGRALDLFVLYGSVAPLVGSPGQASYAAANAALAAVAEARRARGLPAQHIDFGPWRDVGMMAAGEHRAHAARLGAIEPAAGARLLDALLGGRGETRVAAIPFDLAAMGEIMPAARRWSLWKELCAGESGRGQAVALRALPAGERRARVAEELRVLLAKSLMIDVERVRDEASPAALGVDSMVAVELMSRLEARLGIEVPAVVFRSATVADLARDLAARLDEKAPAAAKSAGRSGRWLAPVKQGEGPVALLFPYSGTGASAYVGWGSKLPEGISAYAVQLPGREDRRDEAPLRRAEDVVRAILPALEPLAGRPLVLFGHSMGTILAFEVARALRARGREPRHLVVSAMSGPTALVTPPRPRHTLSDAQLAAELLGMREQGMAAPSDEEMQRHVLPAARADFEILETYRRDAGEGLTCPVTAIAAGRDRLVRAEDVAAWRRETSGAFKLVEVGGGHLYLHHQAEAICRLLAEVCRG